VVFDERIQLRGYGTQPLRQLSILDPGQEEPTARRTPLDWLHGRLCAVQWLAEHAREREDMLVPRRAARLRLQLRPDAARSHQLRRAFRPPQSALGFRSGMYDERNGEHGPLKLSA
jgi:hypothetical protein